MTKDIFKNFIEKELRSGKSSSYLGVIYKYLGDETKANAEFQDWVNHLLKFSNSKYGLSSDGSNENISSLFELGNLQIKAAVYFTLAKVYPDKANQLFEWAAENCFLSEEYVRGSLQAENFHDVAKAFLWRGYSLVCLERYKEALELVTQVVPLLNQFKKTGNEMYHIREYHLPKALVPLCEYKLDPTQDNLDKAKDGLETYINSLREPKDRLEGYLYYFHLKEKFPEVYSANEAPIKESNKPLLEIKKPVLPKTEQEATGSVIVSGTDTGYLEVLGRNEELEEYVNKVKELGEYPTLSNMFELYATQGDQDPEPVVKECEHLLKRKDANNWLKEKTKLILEVAKDAEEKKSTIMLYYDPEVSSE